MGPLSLDRYGLNSWAPNGRESVIHACDRLLGFLLALLLVLRGSMVMATGIRHGGDTMTFARTTVFASALGNGLLFSINWDRRWHLQGTRWMSVSAGMTYYPCSDCANGYPVISLPLQWNWFRGQKHHREHGAGLTYGSNWYGGWSVDGEPLASQGIYILAKPIGYRYQRRDGGFFLRLNVLAWVRVIELNQRYVEANGYWETPPVFPWMGLDLGYTFKQRNRPAAP